MDEQQAVRAWWDGLDRDLQERVLALRGAPLTPEVVHSLTGSAPLRAAGIVPTGAMWTRTRVGYRYYLPDAVEELLRSLG